MVRYNGKAAIEEIFSKGGLLEKSIENYEPRSAQKKMALAIEKAFREKRFLIVEAGTGIGKTFSYLVPALLFAQNTGKKLVISTFTKNLQQQLFSRDLPKITSSLGLHTRSALLMGRSNYFCLARLGRINLKELDMPLGLFSEIHLWAAESQGGTFEEWPFNDQPHLWSHFAADADICLHQFCPYQGKCFVMKARKECQESDVIVVNHHLFFSDLVLQGEGDGGVLPKYSTIIFDEAHRLEEAGVSFLGLNFIPEHLEAALKDLQSLLPKLKEEINDERLLGELALEAKRLKDLLKIFSFTIDEELGKAENLILENRRLPDFKGQPSQVLEALTSFLLLLASLPEFEDEDFEGSWREIKIIISKALDSLRHFIAGDLKDYVFWLGKDGKRSGLFALPLGIDEFLSTVFFPELDSALFTSATLSVNNDTSFYASSLGLPQERTDQVMISSPFDYSYQASVMVPNHLPQPSEINYTKECIEFLKDLIPILGPRSLFLFTSYKMLREAQKELYKPAEKKGIAILAQGDKGPHNLLEEFKEKEKAILLGTSRFWEGVDLPGDYLTSLVIFRLPFPVPSDPWIKGKSQQLTELGKNPFTALSLPQAIIKFKQGLGRLIRSFDDRGLFFVLDKRLYSSNYSKFFLEALPSGLPLVKGNSEEILAAGKKFWQA